MDDLISRQAAIDALPYLLDYEGFKGESGYVSKNLVRTMLKGLPPVTPKQTGCEDAVSRKWLIETAEEGWIKFDTEEDYNRYIHLVRDIAPSVAPKQTGWIPCDVRTPKHVEESYWICTDTGYQCQCRWTNNVFGLGESDEWDWKFLDIPQYSRVVAWMPLPEPWKGEQP